MKNTFIKILSLLTAISLCFSLGVHSIAQEEEWDSLSTKLETLVCVDSRVSISSSMVLRSSSNETLYLLLKLNPTGYAIYNVESSCFEEISLYSTETPYDTCLNEQCYYFGPGRYCFIQNGTLLDAKNGNEISPETFEQFSADEEAKQLFEARQSVGRKVIGGQTRYDLEQTTHKYIANSFYFTSLIGDNFGDNNETYPNSCTAVACGILLRYYDFYINDGYVSPLYYSGYGINESFHSLLYTVMGPSCGIWTAANYLNGWYFPYYSSAPGPASTDIGSCNNVFLRVPSKINQGRPLVAAMFTSQSTCPYNHSVVVYGYSKTVDVWTNELVAMVYHCHFGWKTDDRLQSINYAWFADDLYLP